MCAMQGDEVEVSDMLRGMVRGRVGEVGLWVMVYERISCLGSGGKCVGHHTHGQSIHTGKGSHC